MASRADGGELAVGVDLADLEAEAVVEEALLVPELVDGVDGAVVLEVGEDLEVAGVGGAAALRGDGEVLDEGGAAGQAEGGVGGEA